MRKGSEVFANAKPGDRMKVMTKWVDYRITEVTIDGVEVENDIVELKKNAIDIPYAYVIKGINENDDFVFTFGKDNERVEGVSFDLE